MSSEVAHQILDTSIDKYGISTVTSSKDPAVPRQGIIYDPRILAAGRLVHIHPSAANYTALFKERWFNGAVGTQPQYYTGHEVDEEPYWVVFHPSYGVIKSQGRIPTHESYTTRVLQGGVSRNHYLFLIQRLDEAAFIQHLRNTQESGLELVAEEYVPPAGDVVFDKGLFWWGDVVCVYGSNASGQLYVARKPWSRIGVPSNRTGTAVWQYQTDRGWSVDPGDAMPLNIASDGPVSYAAYRNKAYLSVHNGSVVEVHSSRGLYDPWKRILSYAGTEDFSFQSHIPLSDLSTSIGFPYITSSQVTNSGEESIAVSWGKFSV